MSITQSGQADVVVVGAGPVGLTAALVLAARGVRVLVLESGEGLSEISRASTVHASTLELMDELGVAWEVIRQGEIIPSVQYRERKRGPIAEFQFALIRDFTRFPLRMQTDQARIVRILAHRLSAFTNCSIVFGQAAVAVDERGDDGVVVNTAASDGGVAEYRARYVIGADGARSAIRKSLGLGFTGDTYEIRLLKILTTFDVTGAIPDLARATYVFDDEEPFGALCLPDHTRVTFHLKPHEDAEEVVRPESVQQRLSRALPPADGGYPVSDVLLYSLHRRIADRFRVGNVFLAGDSAHLNHPAGGMGMNSGIHDAYLLGKTLSDVIEGEASEAALDGYAACRYNVALGYVHARSDKNAKSMRSAAELNQERDEKLRRTASDPKLAREFLLRASMFDTAPRVVW